MVGELAPIIGFQMSVDKDAHAENMASNSPEQPVLYLMAVGPAESEVWRRRVHQVRFLGPTRTEYGWGEERANARGRRFGAAIWLYTEAPIEFLDADKAWQVASPGTLATVEEPSC